MNRASSQSRFMKLRRRERNMNPAPPQTTLSLVLLLEISRDNKVQMMKMDKQNHQISGSTRATDIGTSEKRTVVLGLVWLEGGEEWRKWRGEGGEGTLYPSLKNIKIVRQRGYKCVHGVCINVGAEARLYVYVDADVCRTTFLGMSSDPATLGSTRSEQC